MLSLGYPGDEENSQGEVVMLFEDYADSLQVVWFGSIVAAMVGPAAREDSFSARQGRNHDFVPKSSWKTYCTTGNQWDR